MKTIKKAIRRAVSYAPEPMKNIVRRLRKYWHKAKRHWCTIRQEVRAQYASIGTNELFMQQNANKGYNRLDVVVRYLAIEEYYGKNTYGFDLYLKMQKKRVPSKSATAMKIFRDLIESYEANGYDPDSKILLNRDLELVDGSHRLALSLWHGNPVVSCKVSGTRDVSYGLDWFVKAGFTPDELNTILCKYAELKEKTTRQAVIICVLWPPVYPFFNEICESLNQQYELKKYTDYNYSEEDFKETVRSVYKSDDIADWKIEWKIKHMLDFQPKTVRVLEIYTDLPKFRLKRLNNNALSIEGEKIKREYRERYKDRIDNYVYDIILHTGDNYIQSQMILDFFRQQKEYRQGGEIGV